MELLFAFYNHGRLEIYILGNSNSLVISNGIWWDSSGGVWFIMDKETEIIYLTSVKSWLMRQLNEVDIRLMELRATLK